MRVTVIGAGPAGLAAAHAAAGMDAQVRIIAPRKMTPQRGPIMLHRPIPGINTTHPNGYVRQLVIGGSILDYRLKLYGDVNIKINGDILEPGFHTWSVRDAYMLLWSRYGQFIEDGVLAPDDIPEVQQECDLLVNTAPIINLCLNPITQEGYPTSLPGEVSRHEFTSVPVALVFKASYPDQPPNTVIYNAREDIPWVRSSRIFQDSVTEYKPEDIAKPDLIIHKPLSTTCNCHPRMLRMGRFGRWHNETWIDHAYYETRDALVSMIHQKEWDSVR